LADNIRKSGIEALLVPSSYRGDLQVMRNMPLHERPPGRIAVRSPHSYLRVEHDPDIPQSPPRGAPPALSNDRGGWNLMEPGRVVIEYIAPTEHDRIEGPTTETIPLFWQLLLEKFGIGYPPDGKRRPAN
jgi:hypothetical protein